MADAQERCEESGRPIWRCGAEACAAFVRINGPVRTYVHSGWCRARGTINGKRIEVVRCPTHREGFDAAFIAAFGADA